jgi:hypothetical protein
MAVCFVGDIKEMPPCQTDTCCHSYVGMLYGSVEKVGRKGVLNHAFDVLR